MIVPLMPSICEKSPSNTTGEDLDRTSGEDDSAGPSPTLAAENGEEGGELDPPPYLPSPLLLQLPTPATSESPSHPYPLLPAGWAPAIDASTWVLPSIQNYPIPCSVRRQFDVYVPDITGFREDVDMDGTTILALPAACMFESSTGRTACFVVPASTPIAFLSSTDGKMVGYIHVRPVTLARPASEAGSSTTEDRGEASGQIGAPTYAFLLQYVGSTDELQRTVLYSTVIDAPSLIPKPVYMSP